MNINKFSIIASVYGVEKYLDEFFISLVNQTISFERHIELIVVDDGSKDGSAEIVKKWQEYYPNNIRYVYKKNGGLSSARNYGLKYVTTDWVSFIDPDDFISSNYFEVVDLFLLNNQEKDVGLISCNYIFYIESQNKISDTHPLNFRFKQKETVLTAPDLGDFFQISVNAVLLRVDVIRDNSLLMDERVKPNFEDGHFSGRYLLSISGMDVVFLKEAKYYYRKREDGTSLLDTSWGNPEQYYDKFKYGSLDLLNYAKDKLGSIPVYIQRLVLYDFFWHVRYIVNHKERLAFLDAKQKKQFLALIKDIFLNIDVDVVDHFNIAGCWFFHKVGMLGAFKDTELPFQIIYLDSFDEQNKLLKLRYFYSGSLINEQFLVGEKEIEPEYEKTFIHDFLDGEFVNERFVWVKIKNLPLIFDAKIGALDTRLSFKGKHYHHGIGLNEIYKGFQRKGLNDINFPPSVRLTRGLAAHAVTARLYKNAWLFIDRDTQADDNAEHLYRYVTKNHPEVNAFFGLRKESVDWSRLESEGFKLLDFGSQEYKVALLNSEHLISSQADHYITDFLEKKWYGDRINYKFTFLQHGITKDDLSNWLNTKEIDLFITATQKEYESIANDGSKYKFSKKEVILSGFPRHDALLLLDKKVASEKIIAVMPTWREEFVGRAEGGGNKRSLNEQFYTSDYARTWKAFVHSKELKKLIDSFGYTVVFSPHVNIQPYYDWFEVPSYIQEDVSGGESMQSLFCKADLLITDYSSVAFEMAYLLKPVVYYQFDYDHVFGGGHTTNEGYFDYETDGFGAVCFNHEQVINEIEVILKNNCVPSSMYRERIEKTFVYRDGQCCQRVYEGIQNIGASLEIDPIKKVAIFGSCVSRDVFNSKFNEDYKCTHKVVLLENQTTLLSLMSPVIKYKPTSLDPLKKWDRETTKTELDKSFLKEIIKLNPDILIVDFFADSRFKTIASGNSFFTANEWKNTKTMIYEEMNSISEPFFPDEALLLQNMSKLHQFCKQQLPRTKVILNKARAVEYYIDRNGDVLSFRNPLIDKLNKRWDMLDHLFIQTAGGKVKEINAMNDDLKADIEHPWGLGYVHYSKIFYKTFLDILRSC